MAANDKYEQDIAAQGYVTIAGLDETGCGSLCGEVFCCALVFPQNIDYRNLMPGLNDSKQKTAEEREVLYEQIIENTTDYAIGIGSVDEIDEINIYWSKFKAFRRALEKLTVVPDFILIDGNKEVPEIDIPQLAIVKGDGKSISIAAASIIAKVERDRYIIELAKKVHPDYGWASNKGYYTTKHVDALKRLGKTKYHRDKYVRKFI